MCLRCFKRMASLINDARLDVLNTAWRPIVLWWLWSHWFTATLASTQMQQLLQANAESYSDTEAELDDLVPTSRGQETFSEFRQQP